MHYSYWVFGLGLPLELPIGFYKQGCLKDRYISRLSSITTRNPHKTLLISNTKDSKHILCHEQRHELDIYVYRKDKQTEDAESFKKAFARLDGAKEVSDP